MVAFPYPKPSFKKNSISGTVVYAPVPKMEVYIGPIGILYITALGVLTYSLTRFFYDFLHRHGNSKASQPGVCC